MKIDRDSALIHYGALMFGFLTWRILITRGAAISVGSAVVLVCAIEGAVWLFNSSARKRGERLKAAIDRLNTIPLDEAKSRVALLLASQKFESVKSMPNELAASQREFFALYNGIRLDDGTTLEIGARLEPSRYAPGFIVLGKNTCEIVTRRGDERVWEIDRVLADAELDQKSYASIWHYLVINTSGEVRDS